MQVEQTMEHIINHNNLQINFKNIYYIYMSPYILLFISAFIYSIVTIIESKIINNDNYNIFLIILYITKIILIL